MIRRALIWLLLAVAMLGTALAAYLIRPADVHEMLVGLVAGGLSSFQWKLLGAVGVLLVLAIVLDKQWSRTRRFIAIALAVASTAVAGAVIVRDRANFVRETVSVAHDSNTLEGTVYHPREAENAKHPAILILHGSGNAKRNGYHGFARRFAARGFVVLNMDKRGVGGSTGEYYGDDLANGVIETRAQEARAGLNYLVSRADVDTARVGVFSMSQGGWVIPLLLDGSSPARFGVSFSGVAVSSGEEGTWSDWTGENSDHFGFNPPREPFEALDVRLKQEPPSGFNPRPALERMTMPTIWFFGEWDSSAPTAASLRVLDSMKTRQIPIVTRVFPEANHGLMVVRGPRGKRNANFVDGLWQAVFEWTDMQRVTLPSRQ